MVRIFKRKSVRDAGASPRPAESGEPLVPVFLPPLVTLLANHEKEKGLPLTEEEVLAIRDRAVCVTMSVSRAKQMAENCGFDNLTPENCWAEWQEFRKQIEEENAEQTDSLDKQ